MDGAPNEAEGESTRTTLRMRSGVSGCDAIFVCQCVRLGLSIDTVTSEFWALGRSTHRPCIEVAPLGSIRSPMEDFANIEIDAPDESGGAQDAQPDHQDGVSDQELSTCLKVCLVVAPSARAVLHTSFL
jgi:hypothetical protein